MAAVSFASEGRKTETLQLVGAEPLYGTTHYLSVTFY
jgi:hypothetical protein